MMQDAAEKKARPDAMVATGGNGRSLGHNVEKKNKSHLKYAN